MAELTEQQEQARKLWSSGDYPSAMRVIASVGTLVVERAGVTGDDVVLDVACGSGNATIPAAKTGATTTGLDITPELLEAGKMAAAEAGVEIEWIVGDAQDLPFDDASFDVVTSVFGCMFAPDHRRTAEELARVLKPGGRFLLVVRTPGWPMFAAINLLSLALTRRRTWRRIADQAGLRIVDEGEINNAWFALLAPEDN